MNPLERGHVAYRTDDLAAFKAHLKKKGVAFSDWERDGRCGMATNFLL